MPSLRRPEVPCRCPSAGRAAGRNSRRARGCERRAWIRAAAPRCALQQFLAGVAEHLLGAVGQHDSAAPDRYRRSPGRPIPARQARGPGHDEEAAQSSAWLRGTAGTAGILGTHLGGATLRQRLLSDRFRADATDLHLGGPENGFRESENGLAERGGFEPPVELMTLRRFSKPLLSTTQPPLREMNWSVTASYHKERRFDGFGRRRLQLKCSRVMCARSSAG